MAGAETNKSQQHQSPVPDLGTNKNNNINTKLDMKREKTEPSGLKLAEFTSLFLLFNRDELNISILPNLECST